MHSREDYITFNENRIDLGEFHHLNGIIVDLGGKK